jgi:hypothetical protein
MPPILVDLPQNTPDFLQIHNLVPFFVAYFRKHFSTDPSNRFIPALSDLSFINKTIRIESYNQIDFLTTNTPTIYVQLQLKETPPLGITDKTDISENTDLGGYFTSDICTLIFTCLAPEVVICEHLASEIVYLLLVFSNLFSTRLGVHHFIIKEISPPQSLQYQQQETAIPQFFCTITVNAGLNRAWIID